MCKQVKIKMKRNRQKVPIWLLGLLLSGLAGIALAKNAIDGVRVWPSPGSTTIVFDLAAAPKFSYFSLHKPDRLVIDLVDTRENFNFADIAGNSPLIKKLRYSTPKNINSVRVVIELSKKLSSSLFSLPPTEPYHNRLVIELEDKTASQLEPVVVKDSSSAESERDIIIVLDAGHGGEDPGSIGGAGSFEKNITLNIAQRLAKLIDAERGMRAIMTRSGDYYISPNKRPEIARKHKADLLISVHADAFTTPQPSGASVWVLSKGRANSELGRWMEKSERHSELLGGIAEVTQNNTERYMNLAFLDMSMDHSIATSYGLSKRVISQLKGVTKMHKKTPQHASLAVLTAPDIPSILVETGFISNPREEKNLNWADYRQRLAQSIFVALKQHFKITPPDGSLWAMQKQFNRTHKVRSGESLSILAQRYNVRISSLKAANNLNSDIVRIGQVLTIPRT
jgi:N-acetylmuramoyl-L-alanine amidase